MRLDGVQGLRALAAVLVVLQHTIVFVSSAKSIDFARFQPLDFGTVGVWLFFIISGFVMTRCLNQGKWFLLWRGARIYPPFWVAILISFFASAAIPAVPWVFTLGSTTLLPFFDPNDSYLIPYWTLVYEIQFYIVIAVLIQAKISKRVLSLVMITWLTAIYFVNGFQIINDGAIALISRGPLILVSPINIFFIFGFLYGLYYKKLASAEMNKLTTALIAGLAFVVGNYVPGILLSVKFSVVAVSFLLILDLIKEMKMPKVVLFLGDSSYGLYLTHMIAIWLFLSLLGGLVAALPTAAALLLIFSLALIAGTAYGFVEHVFYSHVTRKLLLKTSRR